MNTLTHTHSHTCQAIGLHATLLQIDEMVICGLCGSQIEEELQPPKEFPEELAGTLRHLLQTCRLSINQIPHAKREIRYGQNTVESHIGLDHRRRDESWVYLNEIKPQLDDLCIDLKWFVLDGRRYQSQDTPTSAPGSISVPNWIHKSLQPFMDQGFKFTESCEVAGRQKLRLQTELPFANGQILFIRAELRWRELTVPQESRKVIQLKRS